MNSIIIQISRNPIQKDEYVGVDNINSGDMVSVDYCYGIEPNARIETINRLIETILPKGMFTLNPDGKSMTYHGGYTEWSRQYVETIHNKVTAISEFNVFKYTGPVFQLEKAIINPLGTDTLFITDFYDGMGTAERSREFMQEVNELKIGDKLYIGAVLGYHF